MKTKKELRELEAIVNLYKEQPDNLVNKIWSWRKKALQDKEEEVKKVWKEYIDYVNKNIDSSYYAVYEDGRMRIKSVVAELTSTKKGETK